MLLLLSYFLIFTVFQDYNVLDYDEKILDGFFDIYGFPNDLSSHGKMPSIADLQSSVGDLGFEVVMVNRTIDPALEELLQVAQCISMDCPVVQVSLLVQRIAELVNEHMGGSVRDASVMLARWLERSNELRSSLHTSILPIGCINIGLSRHRALLFKVCTCSVHLYDFILLCAYMFLSLIIFVCFLIFFGAGIGRSCWSSLSTC